MSTWRIEAIPLYDFVVPGSEVLFQRGFGETVAMTIYAFVLFGADKCVLVDTGLPPDIAALNAEIERVRAEVQAKKSHEAAAAALFKR